tara:strand:+ start:420 stop:602 length:183 start_codon:yes stop_codon:yes gene_type:complete
MLEYKIVIEGTINYVYTVQARDKAHAIKLHEIGKSDHVETHYPLQEDEKIVEVTYEQANQ